MSYLDNSLITFSRSNLRYKDNVDPSICFAIIRKYESLIIKNYKDNGYSLYKWSEWAFNKFEYIIDDGVASVSSVFSGETESFKASFKGTTEVGGAIAVSIVGQNELLSLADEVDIYKTFPTVFETDSINEIISQHTQLKKMQKALYKSNLMVAKIVPEVGPIEIKEHLGLYGQSQSRRREFIFLMALLKISSKWQLTIQFNYAYLAASLSLENRLETYVFFGDNRIKIGRALLKARSVDSLGRIDFLEFHRQISQIPGYKRNTDYERHDVDLYYLALMELDVSETALEKSGETFEKRCLEELIKNGFSGYLTKSTGDFGADIIVEKDGLQCCVQCKDWNRPVGVKAVQEVVAARAHYVTDYAVIIVSSSPTRAALELATSCNAVVVNYNDINILGRMLLLKR